MTLNSYQILSFNIGLWDPNQPLIVECVVQKVPCNIYEGLPCRLKATFSIFPFILNQEFRQQVKLLILCSSCSKYVLKEIAIKNQDISQPQN